MNRKQWMVALAGVIALLSLWALSGSVSSIQFEGGQFVYRGESPQDNSQPQLPRMQNLPSLPDWAKTLFLVIIWVLLPASIILLIFKPQLLKTVVVRALMAGLWMFMIMAFARAFDQINQLLNPVAEADAQSAGNETEAFELPDPSGLHIPDWTSWVAVMLAVGVAGWILFLLARNWRQQPDNTVLETELAVQAGAAASALRQGGSLQTVVGQCYQAMCEVLQSRQRLALDTLTPREFEQRLHGAGIRDPLIDRLSRLFERVRYGPHDEQAVDKQEALSCLEGIEKRFGGGSL